MSIYPAGQASFDAMESPDYYANDFITDEELADAALELKIERTCDPAWHCDCEDCQKHNKREDIKMDELISKIQEWLQEDRCNRSATVPVEYLVRVPEVPTIHIYDFKAMEGKMISNVDDMEGLDFVLKKREKLLAELAELDKLAA